MVQDRTTVQISLRHSNPNSGQHMGLLKIKAWRERWSSWPQTWGLKTDQQCQHQQHRLIILKSRKHTHLLKFSKSLWKQQGTSKNTLFINKLAPAYKDYVLSQEPEWLNTATDTARAMWKRKNLAGYNVEKIQNVTLSLITSSIEDSLNNLPDDIREECIMTIKNKRKKQYHSTNQSNYSGNNSSNQHPINNRQANKVQGKKKNKSWANYEAITCWFCNKKGHTQIDCRGWNKINLWLGKTRR